MTRTIYERQDFSATRSNKQLNFLQHVKTILKINGKAAIVVHSSLLFEGGAGEQAKIGHPIKPKFQKLIGRCCHLNWLLPGKRANFDKNHIFGSRKRVFTKKSTRLTPKSKN